MTAAVQRPVPPSTSSARPGAARPDAILALDGVGKTFQVDGQALEVLRGIDLEVRRGEFVCLVGASGCGK